MDVEALPVVGKLERAVSRANEVLEDADPAFAGDDVCVHLPDFLLRGIDRDDLGFPGGAVVGVRDHRGGSGTVRDVLRVCLDANSLAVGVRDHSGAVRVLLGAE